MNVTYCLAGYTFSSKIGTLSALNRTTTLSSSSPPICLFRTPPLCLLPTLRLPSPFYSPLSFVFIPLLRHTLPTSTSFFNPLLPPCYSHVLIVQTTYLTRFHSLFLFLGICLRDRMGIMSVG